MFKKFMDLAAVNKVITKQRKLIKQEVSSGSSAVISAILQAKSQGVFAKYPEYNRKQVNSFFFECVDMFRNSDAFQGSCKMLDIDPNKASQNQVMLQAVMCQAILCNDVTQEEVEFHMNNDSIIKVLVNLKLLPDQFLLDSEYTVTI